MIFKTLNPYTFLFKEWEQNRLHHWIQRGIRYKGMYVEQFVNFDYFVFFIYDTLEKS